jgi:hypothetical protein
MGVKSLYFNHLSNHPALSPCAGRGRCFSVIPSRRTPETPCTGRTSVAPAADPSGYTPFHDREIPGLFSATADFMPGMSFTQSDASDFMPGMLNTKSDASDFMFEMSFVKSDASDYMSWMLFAKSDASDLMFRMSFSKSEAADTMFDMSSVKSDASDYMLGMSSVKSDTPDLTQIATNQVIKSCKSVKSIF